MVLSRKIIYIGITSFISVIISLYISNVLTGSKFNIVVLYATALPVVIYLFYSFSKREISVIHPLFIYSLCYLFIFGVGSTLSIIDERIAVQGGKSVLLGLLGYLLGFAMFYIINKKNPIGKKRINLYQNQKRENYYEYSLKFERVIFAVGIMAFVYYIIKIGTIPLFMANLEQARVDASISGGAYLRIFTYFLIISSVIAFYNFLYAKQNQLKSNYLLSLAVFIIGIIALLLLGNRSPAFTIIYSSLLIYFIVMKNGVVSFKKFILLGLSVSIVLLLFVGGIGSYRVMNTDEFLKYPEYKQFLEGSDYLGLSFFVFQHYLGIGFYNFSRVLQLFPDSIDYKMGLSYFDPIMTVLPGTQYTLDMQIKQALGQTYLGGGTIPSVLGEAYANFGYFGCFVIPFLAAFLLSFLYQTYKEDRTNPAKIIIYVFFLCYLSWNLISGYAATSIFPVISIFVYALYRMYIYSDGKQGVKERQYGKNIILHKSS